jgi:hypothetical protein
LIGFSIELIGGSGILAATNSEETKGNCEVIEVNNLIKTYQSCR